MTKQIQLSHGNGGVENQHLIRGIFFKEFANPLLKDEDAASLEGFSNIAFSTDSFVVSPLFFPGGDIGKLAIYGTSNDLAMMGAEPKYMSCAFIIEEGFDTDLLQKIAVSMGEAAREIGIAIVTGDTKVVGKGAADKIYINTAGIGAIKKSGISAHNLAKGDAIIFSASIGNHGATIYSQREGIALESDLKSDCGNLWNPVRALVEAGINIKALRDATRGGVSAVPNEWCGSSNVDILIKESNIVQKPEVKGICELLGFEPYFLANEGMFVLALPKEEAPKALEVLRKIDITKDAAIVGEVIEESGNNKVILESAWGTKRYLDAPSGELLPRIC